MKVRKIKYHILRMVSENDSPADSTAKDVMQITNLGYQF